MLPLPGSHSARCPSLHAIPPSLLSERSLTLVTPARDNSDPLCHVARVQTKQTLELLSAVYAESQRVIFKEKISQKL